MKPVFSVLGFILTVFLRDSRAQSIDPSESTFITEESTSPTITNFTEFLYVDENVTWNPLSNQQVIVECDYGYKLVASIIKCNIDGTNKEYAKISSGEVNKTLIFTYNVSNTPSYFFNTNRLNAYFFGTDASDFAVVFSRDGELQTTATTELTSSTAYLPTPASDDLINQRYELVVHLTGRDPYDYKNNDTLKSFRNTILQMAEAYTEDQNFVLVDKISLDNVIISEINTCPLGHSRCDQCAEVRFSVPIHTEEDPNSTWTGYQLNSNHLSVMWRNYARKYLTDGILNCEEDPVEKWVNRQILIISICTAGFFVILLVLGQYSVIFAKKKGRMRRRKLSGKEAILYNQDRLSHISLGPHYLQDTPALFDNTYPMYDPGKGVSNVAYESYTEDIPDDDNFETNNSTLEESGA